MKQLFSQLIGSPTSSKQRNSLNDKDNLKRINSRAQPIYMSENKPLKQQSKLVDGSSDSKDYQNINNKKFQSQSKSTYLNHFINPKNQRKEHILNGHQENQRNVEEILSENQMLKRQIDILAQLVSSSQQQQSKNTINTSSGGEINNIYQNSLLLNELDSNTLQCFQSMDQNQYKAHGNKQNLGSKLNQRNSRAQKIQSAYSCELYKKKKSIQQIKSVECKERFENQSIGMDDIDINSSQDDQLLSSLNAKVGFDQNTASDFTLQNTINIHKVNAKQEEFQNQMINHHRKMYSEYNEGCMNYDKNSSRANRAEDQKIKTQIVSEQYLQTYNRPLSNMIKQRVLLDLSINQSVKIENPEQQLTTLHKIFTRLQSRNQVIDEMNGTLISSINDSEISADDATYISNFHNNNLGIITDYGNPLNMHDVSPFAKFHELKDFSHYSPNRNLNSIMLRRKELQYPELINDQTQNMTQSYLSITQDNISNHNKSQIQNDLQNMNDSNDYNCSNILHSNINDESKISITQKQSLHHQQKQLQMNIEDNQDIQDFENQFEPNNNVQNSYLNINQRPQDHFFFQQEDVSKIYEDELWNNDNSKNQDLMDYYKGSQNEPNIDKQKSLLQINDAQTLNQTQNQQDTERHDYHNSNNESSKIVDPKGHIYQDLTQILSDDTSRQSLTRHNQGQQEQLSNFQAALQEVICENQNYNQYSINLESKSSLEDTQEIESSMRGDSKKPFQILDLSKKRSSYTNQDDERNIYRYTPDKHAQASRQSYLSLFSDNKKSFTAKKESKQSLPYDSSQTRLPLNNMSHRQNSQKFILDEQKVRNLVLLNQQIIGQTLVSGQSVESLQRQYLLDNDIIPQQRVTNTKQVTGKFNFNQEDVQEPSARSSRIIQDLSNNDLRVSPREFGQAEIMDTFNPQYNNDQVEEGEAEMQSSQNQETYEYNLIKPQPVIVIDLQYESYSPIIDKKQDDLYEFCNNLLSAKSQEPLRDLQSLGDTLLQKSESYRNTLNLSSNGKSRFTKLAESIKSQRQYETSPEIERTKSVVIEIQQPSPIMERSEFDSRLQQFEEQKNLRINIGLINNKPEEAYNSDHQSLATPSPRVFDSSKIVSQSVEGFQTFKPEMEPTQLQTQLNKDSPKQEYQQQYDYNAYESPIRIVQDDFDSVMHKSNEKFYDTSKIVMDSKESPFKRQSLATNENILIKCETDGLSLRSSQERIISIKNVPRFSGVQVPYQYYDVEELKYQDYSDVRIQTYESSIVNSENEQSEEEKQYFNSWVQDSKVSTGGGIKVYNSQTRKDFKDTNCISEQPSEEDLESTYNGGRNAKGQPKQDYEYKDNLETSQSNEISLGNVEMLDSQMFNQGLKPNNNLKLSTNLESTQKTDSMEMPEEQQLGVVPIKQAKSPQSKPLSVKSITDLSVSKDEVDQQEMKELMIKQEFINQKIQNYKLSLQSIIDNGLTVLQQSSLLSPKSTAKNLNAESSQDKINSMNSSRHEPQSSSKKLQGSQQRIDMAKERRQLIDQFKQQQLQDKLNRKQQKVSSRDQSFNGDDDTSMLKNLKKARNTSSKICINSKKYIESQDYKSANDNLGSSNNDKKNIQSQSSSAYNQQSFSNTKDSDYQANNTSNQHQTLKHDPIKKPQTAQNSSKKSKPIINNEQLHSSRLSIPSKHQQQNPNQSELKTNSSQTSLTRLQAISSARDIIKGVCQQIQNDKEQQQQYDTLDSSYYKRNTSTAYQSQTARSASIAQMNQNFQIKKKSSQKSYVNHKQHQANKLSFAAQPAQTSRQEESQSAASKSLLASPFMTNDSHRNSKSSYNTSSIVPKGNQQSFRIQLIKTESIEETSLSHSNQNNSSYLSNGNVKSSIQSTPKFERIQDAYQGFEQATSNKTPYTQDANNDIGNGSSSSMLTNRQAELFKKITEDHKKRFQLKARLIN